LALKVQAYLRINRADLAEQTLKQLRAIDEDNCLTTLAASWLQLYKCGVPSSVDDLIGHLN